MMRTAFLSAVQSLMCTATTWQQYEVALYGLRAVSLRQVPLPHLIPPQLDCYFVLKFTLPPPLAPPIPFSVKGRVLNRVGTSTGVTGTGPGAPSQQEAVDTAGVMLAAFAEICLGTGNAARWAGACEPSKCECKKV